MLAQVKHCSVAMMLKPFGFVLLQIVLLRVRENVRPILHIIHWCPLGCRRRLKLPAELCKVLSPEQRLTSTSMSGQSRSHACPQVGDWRAWARHFMSNPVAWHLVHSSQTQWPTCGYWKLGTVSGPGECQMVPLDAWTWIPGGSNPSPRPSGHAGMAVP